ncbi:MAG: hypothetical protein JXR83_21740, partial [Deltaproteobacteria bacterium]|nr:hypothetical protein [Deltaproteobacteria bacterium]
ALGYDDQRRLTRIDQDDDHWTLSYDDSGRLERIESESGGVQGSVAYQYTDGDIQGVRIAPRIPLFVNFIFGLDGHPLPDPDLLALPDYF